MFTLRTNCRAYIVFGLMWLTLVLLGITSCFPDFHRDIIFAPSLIFLPFFLWLSVLKLFITDTTISYRTLFGGTKTINRNEIRKYKITIGEYLTSEDRTKPFVRLSIYTYTQKKKPVLDINLQVFDHKKMQSFFDILDADIKENKKIYNKE